MPTNNFNGVGRDYALGEYDALYLNSRSNTIQIPLLTKLAEYMVSPLQVGLTYRMSFLFERIFNTVFLIRYRKRYVPKIDYAVKSGLSNSVASKADNLSECTKIRPIYNKSEMLLYGNFCDTHLNEGTDIKYCHVLNIFPN